MKLLGPVPIIVLLVSSVGCARLSPYIRPVESCGSGGDARTCASETRAAFEQKADYRFSGGAVISTVLYPLGGFAAYKGSSSKSHGRQVAALATAGAVILGLGDTLFPAARDATYWRGASAIDCAIRLHDNLMSLEESSAAVEKLRSSLSDIASTSIRMSRNAAEVIPRHEIDSVKKIDKKSTSELVHEEANAEAANAALATSEQLNATAAQLLSSSLGQPIPLISADPLLVPAKSTQSDEGKSFSGREPPQHGVETRELLEDIRLKDAVETIRADVNMQVGKSTPDLSKIGKSLTALKFPSSGTSNAAAAQAKATANAAKSITSDARANATSNTIVAKAQEVIAQNKKADALNSCLKGLLVDDSDASDASNNE